LASPENVYHYPANLFVADFIGNPKVNLLNGKVDGKNAVCITDFQILLRTCGVNGMVVIGIRPEDVSISQKAVEGAIEFNAYSVLPSGADSTIIARRGDVEITVKEMGVSKVRMDQKIWLTFDSEKLNLYDQESGNLIVTNKLPVESPSYIPKLLRTES
jgi:multiple sugar transport system ATP-binding protein